MCRKFWNIEQTQYILKEHLLLVNSHWKKNCILFETVLDWVQIIFVLDWFSTLGFAMIKQSHRHILMSLICWQNVLSKFVWWFIFTAIFASVIIPYKEIDFCVSFQIVLAFEQINNVFMKVDRNMLYC